MSKDNVNFIIRGFSLRFLSTITAESSKDADGCNEIHILISVLHSRQKSFSVIKAYPEVRFLLLFIPLFIHEVIRVF